MADTGQRSSCTWLNWCLRLGFTVSGAWQKNQCLLQNLYVLLGLPELLSQCLDLHRQLSLTSSADHCLQRRRSLFFPAAPAVQRVHVDPQPDSPCRADLFRQFQRLLALLFCVPFPYVESSLCISFYHLSLQSRT
ncbi:MAG TPA: hypothetical protein H9715_01635 [Candidatus Merdibacter merdigallinarum]|nr:hypothetical protein [Candidatus Merdibacter merdigallinarum]